MEHFFHNSILEIDDSVEFVQIIGAKPASSNECLVFASTNIEPELCALCLSEFSAKYSQIFS